MFRLSTNSSDINIFTQSKHNYELERKTIMVIKTNLSIKPQMKHPMYVVGRIGQGKSYGLRHHMSIANKLGKDL